MAAYTEDNSTKYSEAELKDVDQHQFEHSEEPDGLTWTAEEERKLVRKVDLLLLPTIWIMYLLSYMDRTKYVTLNLDEDNC